MIEIGNKTSRATHVNSAPQCPHPELVGYHIAEGLAQSEENSEYSVIIGFLNFTKRLGVDSEHFLDEKKFLTYAFDSVENQWMIQVVADVEQSSKLIQSHSDLDKVMVKTLASGT